MTVEDDSERASQRASASEERSDAGDERGPCENAQRFRGVHVRSREERRSIGMSEHRNESVRTSHRKTREGRVVSDKMDKTIIVKVERRMADLHAIVEASAAVVRPDLAAKELEFSLDLAAERHWASVDADRMQQVICNLLQNAAKFSNRGGRVTVSTQNRGADIRITVADTGMGMSPAELRLVSEWLDIGAQYFNNPFDPAVPVN